MRGELIGRELRDQQYQASLGAGVNLVREPRNGRNFEYAGEDPIPAGKTVAQLVTGLQSQKVIGEVKMSRRVMRETDLLAFEIAILESRPGMVMCSYNKVNGDWACENDYLLNQLLKRTWGFKGAVISDWNATHSTAKAALARLDAEQPGGPAERARFGDALKKAVDAGEVPMSRGDNMVHRILRTAFAAGVVDDPRSVASRILSRVLRLRRKSPRSQGLMPICLTRRSSAPTSGRHHRRRRRPAR